MWKFTAKDGWKEIEDFLAKHDVADCDKELALSGFSSICAVNVGDEEGMFSVEIRSRSFGTEQGTGEGTNYEYLGAVLVGTGVRYVAIPTLPDLLEFMRQTIPLAIRIDDWNVGHEKYMKKLEKEIAG